ncbi:MAG: methyl-accepting chemotaxis protein [Bacteroidota bacterium]
MASNEIQFIGLKPEENPTLRAFQHGTIASKETKAKVGSKELDLRFTSVPLKDNQGNVVAAFEMFVDETEIKQAMRRNEKLTLYQEKQTEKIVQALEQLSLGNINFDVRLDEPDEDTKEAYERFLQIVNAIKTTGNTIAALSGDANMLANAALEGRLDVRADASKHKGAYKNIIEGMNGALDNLIKPLNVAAEYVDRIAKGDIPPKISEDYRGDFNEIKNNLNQLIDNVNNLYQELGVLINAIGVGNLNVRGDLSKFKGVWNEIINSINEIMLQVETPIQDVVEVLKKVANNDYTTKITKNYQGIWDDLKKSTNDTMARLEHVLQIAKNISFGKLDNLSELKAIGRRSAADELIPSFIKLMEALEAMAEDVRTLAQSAIDGNLSVRADASKHYGIYKEIVSGFNETLDAVIAPVEEAGEVLNTMATGDLTVKVKGNYKGDHKKLQESINTLVDSFNDLIGRLLNSVETTASAAIQISSTADTMATSAQEQSAQTEEVASAIEEMARTVTENANNAQQTADMARQNREIAKEGGQIVELTVSKMSDIARVVKESADNIEKLGESSKQIGEIISVIDDIADQTNLLALNAAIEAARAGEQGRGFAVVADEVRKLAERTTEATKQIAEMIKGIQKDTEIAVHMMQNGNAEVTNGIQLADKAGSALKEIVESSQHLLDMISQIASANEEQAATGEQITKNVAMISEVAQDSSRRVTEIAHSAEDLSRLTDELRELVSQFKIIHHEYEMSSQRSLSGKSNKYLSGRN